MSNDYLVKKIAEKIHVGLGKYKHTYFYQITRLSDGKIFERQPGNYLDWKQAKIRDGFKIKVEK